MKLKTALELGMSCNLTLLEEAIRNVEIHNMNLFVAEERAKEFEELYKEWNMSKFPKEMTIEEALSILKETNEPLGFWDAT